MGELHHLSTPVLGSSLMTIAGPSQAISDSVSNLNIEERDHPVLVRLLTSLPWVHTTNIRGGEVRCAGFLEDDQGRRKRCIRHIAAAELKDSLLKLETLAPNGDLLGDKLEQAAVNDSPEFLCKYYCRPHDIQAKVLAPQIVLAIQLSRKDDRDCGLENKLPGMQISITAYNKVVEERDRALKELAGFKKLKTLLRKVIKLVPTEKVEHLVEELIDSGLALS